MPIPKYDEMMLPLLKFLADGRDYNNKEVHTQLAEGFRLCEQDLSELLPSGKRTVFKDRVQWAKTYLKFASLITYPKRGVTRNTPRGRAELSTNPSRLNVSYLLKYKELAEFVKKPCREGPEASSDLRESSADESSSPEDLFRDSFNAIQEALIDEILERVASIPPLQFEQVVVDLLINMGYGGSRSEAGIAFSKGKDEGIDGVINEDKLGLDVIYVQAKKYEASNPIGRPDIQRFAGALQGKKAKKGVFITTSYFSKDALEYTQKIDTKIKLINGRKLAELMIESNTGASTVETIHIKRIDNDYFEGFA